ncbi:MAG: extracellular solute-binding protein [Sphaerochaetaceae bacterium]|jgi:spermidine/putrescine transport system substrate-binding protein
MKSAKLFLLALMLPAILFFGCSKSSGRIASESPSDKSSQEKKLYIYNWSYYTPESVIDAFSKKYDCQVILDYFASNEEMYAKLKAAGTGAGYDIIVPSGDYVSIMKAQNMLEKIDLSKFPNKTYITPLVLQKAEYDPTMEYSVPYYMGAAGIAVNKNDVKDYERNWSIFGDTRLAGRMCMMDDMREVLGDALKYLGYSVNTTDPDELEKARLLVKNSWKPNLVKFDAEGFAKSFAQGEYYVTQGYAEGIFEEIPEEKRGDVDFFIPGIGGPMYIDSMCIPKGAKHYDMAMEFINFIHDPKNYAQFLDRFHFPASVNSAADQYRTTVPFYTVDDLKNCELKNDLGTYLDAYNTAWESIRYVE